MVEGIRLITAEDADEALSSAAPVELVEGEIVQGMWSGDSHGILATELGFIIHAFVRERAVEAYVTIEGTGYLLTRAPDTVRAPDIGLIFKARAGKQTGKAFQVAPDLAVEIVSPNDRAAEVDDKIQAYLRAGTRLIWVIYPDSRTVYAFTPDGITRLLSADDALDGAGVLPGFTHRVGDLFALLDE